jgi:hypothetical protein
VLSADGAYRFDQINQIAQARRAAAVLQHRAHRYIGLLLLDQLASAKSS